MQNAVKRAVNLLFESFPFSKENEECRETIMSLAEQNLFQFYQTAFFQESCVRFYPGQKRTPDLRPPSNGR